MKALNDEAKDCFAKFQTGIGNVSKNIINADQISTKANFETLECMKLLSLLLPVIESMYTDQGLKVCMTFICSFWQNPEQSSRYFFWRNVDVRIRVSCRSGLAHEFSCHELFPLPPVPQDFP